MNRLAAGLTFALLVLAPALASADVTPSRGGCNRCSVDDERGQAGALFALVGLGCAVALRRRQARG